MRRPMASAKEEAKRKRKRHFSKTVTAEDVAEILEEKYTILHTFYNMHAPDIIDSLRNTFIKRMEGVLLDKPNFRKALVPKKDLAEIEKSFRTFLDKKEMNGMPGVPTLASILGTSHFFKTRRPGRPSFIDTGIYRAAFKVREK